jgi:hypothetical protein
LDIIINIIIIIRDFGFQRVSKATKTMPIIHNAPAMMDETRSHATYLPESTREQFIVVVGMLLSDPKFLFLEVFQSSNLKDLLIEASVALGEGRSNTNWTDVLKAVREFFFKGNWVAGGLLGRLPADYWVDLDRDGDADEERAIYSIQLLLLWLLHNSGKCESSRILYETRLGQLVDRNPTILTEGGNFLNIYCMYPFYWKNTRNESFDIPVFETIFKLGISHYPTELGFVFHNTTFSNASKLFGTKKVVQIINDKLFSTLGQNSNETLQALVLAAASNDKISLDGVYTLFRHDPIAVLSESTKSIKKRRDYSCSASPSKRLK